MNSKMLNYFYLAVAIIGAVFCAILIATGRVENAGLPMVFSLIALAMYSRSVDVLKGVSFTFWVFGFLAAAMYYPIIFTNWGFNTQKIVIPLIQLIMFGMGTKLSLSDFWKEFKNPVPILAGTTLIFTIMPLIGVIVAKVFNFPTEIAAGVILIGACPGGAASNVMTYLAKGNVALSVSLTTFATLLAPVITPIIMKYFAGKLIDVNVISMMISTLNMIIVPIFAGLLVNKMLYGKAPWLKNKLYLAGIAVLCIALGSVSLVMPFGKGLIALQSGLVLVFFLIAIVVLTKIYMELTNGPANWMDKFLPKLSMLAILFYVTIVVAHYRDKLLVVGFALILASIIHNLLGYVFGYGAAKMLRLKERDCRALAIEVGLKNGGLGTGLALDALHSPDAALAPVVFGKWMNISGSTLANYWRQKKINDEPSESL